MAASLVRAAGMKDADFDKPMIGIVNTWSTVTPCNMHLDRLAKDVRAGIVAAGGYPVDFNTIVVTDGISMGTAGMKASLISREVVADAGGKWTTKITGVALKDHQDPYAAECKMKM